MTKTAKNAQECIHHWASKIGGSRHTRTRNVYFDSNGTIYSYGPHFPMARHLVEGVVAITTRNSTPTTNGQMQGVRQAVNHLRRIYVHAVNESASSQKKVTEDEITELLGKSERARVNKDMYMSQATSLAADFNEYAKIMKERVRIPMDRFGDWATLMGGRDERERRVERARDKARDLELVKQRDEWRTGKNCYVPGSIMLRLSWDGDFRANEKMTRHVETSAGAEIPLDDAKRLWPVIQRCMAGDKDYEVGMGLGSYRLTKVRTNGSIVVGCHDIAYSEIEGIAKQLGLLEEVTA
jgi:hypothetical protein